MSASGVDGADREERDWLNRQISVTAERRVTWGNAARLLEEVAAAHFLASKDDLASEFRRVAKTMRAKEAEASEEQAKLLKRERL